MLVSLLVNSLKPVGLVSDLVDLILHPVDRYLMRMCIRTVMCYDES